VLITVIAPGVWLCLALAARSDGELEPAAAMNSRQPADARYMGSMACSLCHDNGAPKFDTNIVGLDEFHIWAANDHHRFAFSGSDDSNPALKLSGLKGERAQAMEKALHWAPGSAIKAENGCVNCHAINHSPKTSDASIGSNPERLAKELALGVGCEACHGPSSLWIDKHWKRAAWRDDHELTPQVKQQKYGMVDVRDPIERTRLCVSCHVGNVAEGKFVTHEMFAAGHPLLPAFEVETSLNKMPPHWRPVTSQSPNELKEYVHYQPLTRSRSVALEGLIELRESVGNLAAAGQHQKLVGDFALYDCNACHHELVIPSRRQDQGYGGLTPGRPTTRYWSSPLSEIGRGQSNKLDTLLAPLDAALNRSPFGDSASLEPQAKQVMSGLDKLIESTAKQEPLDVKQLVAELRRLASEPPGDRDAAQQLAAAIDVVASELADPANAEPLKQVDAGAIADLRKLADRLRAE
jgi:hypothetical protein